MSHAPVESWEDMRSVGTSEKASERMVSRAKNPDVSDSLPFKWSRCGDRGARTRRFFNVGVSD